MGREARDPRLDFVENCSLIVSVSKSQNVTVLAELFFRTKDQGQLSARFRWGMRLDPRDLR